MLELIARYVIELLNPELKNIVECRTAYYKRNYRTIFEYKNGGDSDDRETNRLH